MVELEATCLQVQNEGDIVVVRRTIRDVASALGFGVTDVTRIVTAASELARNIILYASRGTITYRRVVAGDKEGLEILFEDDGPGIGDIELAMRPGHTTGGGLGLGLPGAKRLMDEMQIDSVPGEGTRVRIAKWLRRR